VQAIKHDGRLALGDHGKGAGSLPVPAHLASIADGPVTLGFQPHHLSLAPPFEAAPSLKVITQISEIAGSESFVHVRHGDSRWVMLTHGVCDLDPALEVDVFVDTRHLMAFGDDGKALGPEPSAAAA